MNGAKYMDVERTNEQTNEHDTHKPLFFAFLLLGIHNYGAVGFIMQIITMSSYCI